MAKLERFVSLVSTALLFALFTPPSHGTICTGDCAPLDRNVTVNEVVKCVNIALDRASVDGCTSCDQNGNRQVEVNELVGGVNIVLSSFNCDEVVFEPVPDVLDKLEQVPEGPVDVLDFGPASNTGGIAGSGLGTAGLSACFCPDGGSVDNISCRQDAGESSFSGRLINCRSGSTTRNGNVSLVIEGEADFCGACIIPLNTTATLTFAPGFVAQVDSSFPAGRYDMPQGLTEVFQLTGSSDCPEDSDVPPFNRRSTFDGTLRKAEVGEPGVVSDFSNLEVDVSFTTQAGRCKTTTVQTGVVHVEDDVNDREFTETAARFEATSIDEGSGRRSVTLNTLEGGSLEISCLGRIALNTLEPLNYDSLFAECATAGLIEVIALDEPGQPVTGLRYTSAGGLEFDFDFGGNPSVFSTDQSFPTCVDEEIQQCRPPVLRPPSPTPSPTATTASPPTATRTPVSTPTPTLSATRAFSVTPSSTASPTNTPQPSRTPTETPTLVHTPTTRPTIEGCATLVEGQIEGETWTAAGSPYCVDGDVLVKGAGLVIEPGVRVEFQGDYVVEVQGTLKAIGTEPAPIVFTKGADSAEPVGRGLFLNNAAAGSALKHCRIEFLNDSGLRIVNSFPTIENCTITNNKVTGNGGGVRVALNGSPGELVIKNSHIDSNSATEHGGGIYAELSSGALTLENSTINNNRANSSLAVSSYFGGGIYALANGGLNLKRSEVNGNYTYAYCFGGGCGSYAYGAGLYIEEGFVDVETSTIASNLADAGCGSFGCVAYAHGGGVYVVAGGVELENSVVSHNATRGSHEEGSGIFSSAGAVALLNATVAYNSDDGVHNSAGVLQARNSIVYLNSGTQIEGAATVNYSDIQGGYTGTGNITLDPDFMGVTDLRLSCDSSPAVDVGDPRFIDACTPPGCTTDLGDLGAFGGRGNCSWLTD